MIRKMRVDTKNGSLRPIHLTPARARAVECGQGRVERGSMVAGWVGWSGAAAKEHFRRSHGGSWLMIVRKLRITYFYSFSGPFFGSVRDQKRRTISMEHH